MPAIFMPISLFLMGILTPNEEGKDFYEKYFMFILYFVIISLCLSVLLFSLHFTINEGRAVDIAY